ncbi:MAG TPA: sulfatase [Verrucomicrobiales bacterium]|nr:sulfatase [Verrucomicrobiales bacterium]HBE96834.1 sulfatase [Verrucomicrobiales bacterium]|tara:strand:+ start:171 stop:1583 length:1413 start_codon:yes stop_codon:yes gene_type:complete
MIDSTFSADLTRRAFLGRSAGGIGSVALASLLNDQLQAGQGSLSNFHHAPKAKRVIFLFMAGGPSHIDLFDPKPKLNELDGKKIPQELLKDHQQFALIRGTPNLKGSPYSFRQHGQSGLVISELLPHLSKVADELTVIRSMHTDTNVHDPGVNFMNCGTLLGDRPTLGSWMSYGLGSDNQDLPAYTVLTSGVSDGQPLLQSFWGNGFLDSRHAGVPFRNSGAPVLHLDNPKGVSTQDRRRELDLIQWMNGRRHEALGDPEITTRIASYELAFRMQASVPQLADLSKESEKTMEKYGADRVRPSFARNCLMARRLVERGVRFVQLYDRGWDSHTDMDREHRRQCGAADQPIAALIADLKQRGLLDDTLVIWGGEFGRTPVAQVMGKTWGRDHHPHGFTMWMAGGGMKPGLTYGATDEFGYHAVENKVHVHDLHATILHQLGIDHKRLTFRSQGRDFRLTDVHGHVVRDLLA